MAEMELRVCPKTQMSMERKEPTIPAAANDSKPSTGNIAHYGRIGDGKYGLRNARNGSRNRQLIDGFKVDRCSQRSMQVTALIHNNEKDVRFVWEKRYRPIFDIPVAHRNVDCVYSAKKYPIALT